jgi:hypothetical protein
MNSEKPKNSQLQQLTEENSERLPMSFSEAVGRVKNFAIQEFDREVQEKQLYYHTYEHISGVERRAKVIFQAIAPYWEASFSEQMVRMELLVELCAIAHDMVQIFVPQNQPHTSRRREAGVSETATMERLFDYIKSLNQQLEEYNADSSALFTDADLAIIQEAIAATICLYDPSDRAIYQPALYNTNEQPSPVARIIALADIGALGMEGIASYNQEGTLLFLEENPDIIPLILDKKLQTLASENFELYENIRERLLKRARFQVNFAQSRLNRQQRELAGLPAEAIPVLIKEVFQYLNQETVQEIASMTPTDEATPLETLIEFFNLEQMLSNASA